MKDGKKACSMYGTYLGFMEFDGVRYWDGRHLQAVKIKLEDNPLKSDFRYRSDLETLKAGNLEQAQIEK